MKDAFTMTSNSSTKIGKSRKMFRSSYYNFNKAILSNSTSASLISPLHQIHEQLISCNNLCITNDNVQNFGTISNANISRNYHSLIKKFSSNLLNQPLQNFKNFKNNKISLQRQSTKYANIININNINKIHKNIQPIIRESLKKEKTRNRIQNCIPVQSLTQAKTFDNISQNKEIKRIPSIFKKRMNKRENSLNIIQYRNRRNQLPESETMYKLNNKYPYHQNPFNYCNSSNNIFLDNEVRKKMFQINHYFNLEYYKLIV